MRLNPEMPIGTPLQKSKYDRLFLTIASMLMVYGIIMIDSATSALKSFTSTELEQFHLILRHIVYLGIGLFGAFFILHIPMKLWKKLAPLLFIGTLLLLALSLLIGHEVKGASRWIGLGPIRIQPAEIMKLAAILYCANFLARKQAIVEKASKSFAPMLAIILCIGSLLIMQPDFGSLVIITMVIFSMMFIAGVSLVPFVVILLIALAGFAGLIIVSPYRLARVVAFLNPWQDPFGQGYQLTHALMAFGHGGFLGVGLGQSVEKLDYLPEAHTDFIFAVIGEELGFLGVLLLVCLFWLLLRRIFRIAKKAETLNKVFSAFTAYGVGTWIGLQALLHMLVNLGLLPTKGLTLPLLSYGGSALTMTIFALAIVARIDWETRCLLWQKS
jgi:cell division protein FtsW